MLGYGRDSCHASCRVVCVGVSQPTPVLCGGGARDSGLGFRLACRIVVFWPSKFLGGCTLGSGRTNSGCRCRMYRMVHIGFGPFMFFMGQFGQREVAALELALAVTCCGFPVVDKSKS